MCIMEVRPGQRSSTIAQAMAHNTSTVERDLDMFKPLLEARGEAALLRRIETAHQHLKEAYALFLSVFADEVTTEVHVHGDVDHGDHSHERPAHDVDKAFTEAIEKVADRDARLARRFMTR